MEIVTALSFLSHSTAVVLETQIHNTILTQYHVLQKTYSMSI